MKEEADRVVEKVGLTNPINKRVREPVYLWDWLNQLFPRLDLPPLSRSLNFKTAFFIGSGLERMWSLLKIKKEPPMTRFVACQLAHDHWFSIKSAEADLSYKLI